jgi:hypothetical protein
VGTLAWPVREAQVTEQSSADGNHDELGTTTQHPIRWRKLFRKLGVGWRDVVMLVLGALLGAAISIPTGEYVSHATAPPAFRVAVSGEVYQGDPTALVVSVRNTGAETTAVHRVTFSVENLMRPPVAPPEACPPASTVVNDVYMPALFQLPAAKLPPTGTVQAALVIDGSVGRTLGSARNHADVRIAPGGLSTFLLQFATDESGSPGDVAIGSASILLDGGLFKSRGPVALLIQGTGCGPSGDIFKNLPDHDLSVLFVRVS